MLFYKRMKCDQCSEIREHFHGAHGGQLFLVFYTLKANQRDFLAECEGQEAINQKISTSLRRYHKMRKRYSGFTLLKNAGWNESQIRRELTLDEKQQRVLESALTLIRGGKAC